MGRLAGQQKHGDSRKPLVSNAFCVILIEEDIPVFSNSVKIIVAFLQVLLQFGTPHLQFGRVSTFN